MKRDASTWYVPLILASCGSPQDRPLVPPPPPVGAAAEGQPDSGLLTSGEGTSSQGSPDVNSPRLTAADCSEVCRGRASAGLAESLQRQAASTRRCYNHALALNPLLKGHIDVRLKIDSDGAICASEVTQNDTGSQELAECVVGFLRAPVHYPAPSGGCIMATVPLAFEPQRPVGAPPSDPSSGASIAASGAAPLSSERLGPEAIRQTVIAHRGEILACYTASSPPDAGKGNGLTVHWRIAPDGSVTDATVVGSTVDEPTEACVLRRLRAWRFPASGKSSDVTFPFEFAARP